MTQATSKKLTFDEFLQQCPEDGIYELVNGKIVKVEPTRAHKNVARFLVFAFNDEIRRLGFDYDDCIDKLDEYRRLGIPEYWIVDYLAIASRTYLGNPKVPTVSVYQLVGDEYQVQRFTGNNRIISPTFPEL